MKTAVFLRVASFAAAGLIVAMGATPSLASQQAPDEQTVALAPIELPEREVDEDRQTVRAVVDLSDQTMRIFINESEAHNFTVSTGRGRYRTPTGEWQAGWLAAKWRSRKYNNAPMPWSVFFYRGYAVHGTTDIKRLGRPASHGCIRLHPDNAKTFYRLVESVGKSNTTITIVN